MERAKETGGSEAEVWTVPEAWGNPEGCEWESREQRPDLCGDGGTASVGWAGRRPGSWQQDERGRGQERTQVQGAADRAAPAAAELPEALGDRGAGIATSGDLCLPLCGGQPCAAPKAGEPSTGAVPSPLTRLRPPRPGAPSHQSCLLAVPLLCSQLRAAPGRRRGPTWRGPLPRASRLQGALSGRNPERAATDFSPTRKKRLLTRPCGQAALPPSWLSKGL